MANKTQVASQKPATFLSAINIPKHDQPVHTHIYIPRVHNNKNVQP